MNKKAQLTQIVLINLILLLVVIASLFGAINLIQDDRIFDEKKVSMNIALIHDTMLGAPNKLDATINIPKKYEITVDKTDGCKIISQIKNENIKPATTQCINSKEEVRIS